jgi:hypothetical protein
MSYLCIIPASAVADPDLSDTQVRVLCAIGTFTNRLGGNVWASVATLAKSCNLNPRSVQRAVPVLIERGYLKRMPRTGRTTIYEVVLQTAPFEEVTQESLGGDLVVTPPPTTQSPKREKERYRLTDEQKSGMDYIWSIFPQRTVPHLYVPFAAAFSALCEGGTTTGALVRSAEGYVNAVIKDGTDPKYIKTLHRFYADDSWKAYCVLTVEGRTRDEWARSGQDVAEFDRLSLSHTSEPHVA